MAEKSRPITGWQSENLPYATIVTGECIIGTAAAVLGTATAALVMLQASSANSGTAYIGASTVTVPNGTADTTTGWQLVPGATTPWLPISNVSQLWGIASAASQQVFFVALY